MCEGKSFHIHAPVTGKARRPTDGRNKQIIGGIFLSRMDVSDVCKVPKIQRNISMYRLVSLHVT